ncbi:MAG TPA: hypothetical protein VGK61_10630, partial [Planctomycetota bacterium]
MATLIAVVLALGFQSADLQRLENMDPEIRYHAVCLAGQERNTAAVRKLIGRLRDTEPRVQAAAQEALVKITRIADLKDVESWEAWWAKEGRTRFPELAVTSDEILRQVDTRVDNRLSIDMAAVEAKVTGARNDVRVMAVSMAVAIFIFLIVMIFFVGHVSSKIKGWRELVSRAEIYVKHGQELTERTDKIAAELETRKAEVAAFLDKIRKEQEEVISRRGDELGSELAHELR